ncbi:ABC transporter substrate-binding protein [uncultured Thermanaerothrix sp.]|uniref:ABC transporter substrate-binding protein n=1 Tax=uncultured Thermanaerothrix sp. TaxID=1195149 RepID=UPI002633F7C3|nr:ABC transporter substrate-binding protein [uncultured Thermanaerothrix sp.]
MRSRLVFSLMLVLSLFLVACTAVSAIPTPTPPPSPVVTTRLEPTATQVPTASPTPVTITFIDALGREVTLSQPPQRVVIAGRATALLADAAFLFPEAKDKVVALSSTSQSAEGDFLVLVDPNLPKKIAFETNVGAEQVVTAQPDLVIMKTYMAEPLGKPLETLGIPVVYLSLETPEEYQRDLRILGQIFQNPQRAEEMANFFAEQVSGITQPLQGLTPEQRPRTLLLYYSDRDGQVAFNVAPKTWIQTIVTELAGGRPVWTDIELGSGWTRVNLEQIAAWDADVIAILAYTADPEAVVARLKEDPQWQAMRAVREGRLYAFPKDFYSWDQPDVRWVLGLRWLAWRLHPEAYPGLDMKAETQAFFERLYGIDAATFESRILPILKGDLE